MKLAILGTGYVGLVTGVCFAELGHKVVCCDVDEAKIASLCAGRIPLYEPGLAESVARNVAAGRLTFTTQYSEAVEPSLLLFICVNTPQQDDGSNSTDNVAAAARGIAQHMNGYKIVVTKSTVPIGTTHKVRSLIQVCLDEREVDHSFDVVSNPEFLKEGAALRDFMEPDRVVIGADDVRVAELMKGLYQPMAERDRVLVMSVTSAELTKYAANSVLATRLSFMNELAGVCERVGANVDDLKRGIGSDSRIGSAYLNAGIGYGPKNIAALGAAARAVGCDMPILEATQQINLRQKRWLSDKLAQYYGGAAALRGKVIAVWGLAFKPNTDDMREAPSLQFCRDMLAAGASLRLFDPQAMATARVEFADASASYTDALTWCDESEIDAATGADAIALLTEWKQFRFADMQQVLGVMRGHAFFDGRNLFAPRQMARLGFDYVSVGRPPHLADAYLPSGSTTPQ